tara:strand:- start:947 stop:1582 length:636 start_codon:yes stop_codon:yes gene_type:complete
MIFSYLMRKTFASLVVVVVLFLFFVLNNIALAHHPFGMGETSQLSTLQGFLSGVGHPLLGPDHLLFMLALAFVGLRKPIKWVVPLLIVGLGGSLFSQLQSLPDLLVPWAETLVSLSLIIEGLVILDILGSKWLLPMFAFHGYLLGSTIIGAEATPLIGYFGGLFIAQGSCLLFVTAVSKRIMERIGGKGRILIAGIWMGIGSAFAWIALVD